MSNNALVLTKDVSNELVTISNRKAELKKELEAIEEAEEKIKSYFLKEFEATGYTKVENDEVMITYVSPSETESIDLKKLSISEPKLNNDLLARYPLVKKRKAFIKITCKKP